MLAGRWAPRLVPVPPPAAVVLRAGTRLSEPVSACCFREGRAGLLCACRVSGAVTGALFCCVVVQSCVSHSVFLLLSVDVSLKVCVSMHGLESNPESSLQTPQ